MAKNKKTAEKLAQLVIWTAAILVLAVLGAVIAFVLINGLVHVSWDFLTKMPRNMGRSGGISSTVVGTLAVTILALVIAVPFGVGTAFYLAEYTHENFITKVIRFSAEALAGIPSIVYGLFGFIFFVTILDLDWSILSGSLTLAFMILPTLIRTAEEAIKSVPASYRELSYSLGATKWQTMVKVVFPSALRGIVNGILLSSGRCVAETAAVILTAGSSLRMPSSIFSPARTMAIHFYILAREGISMENAYGTAALLVILIFLINVGANMIMNRFVKKQGKV